MAVAPLLSPQPVKHIGAGTDVGAPLELDNRTTTGAPQVNLKL